MFLTFVEFSRFYYRFSQGFSMVFLMMELKVDFHRFFWICFV